VPYTRNRVCHRLFRTVALFPNPEVVEVSCGYGKATIYLAAAAKATGGFVRAVDSDRRAWQNNTVEDLLKLLNLSDVCDVNLDEDARWYLLDLLTARPGYWIDVAYVDASHTVEVDAFVALALWTHLRPGGVIVFDDLDWIPAVHGPGHMRCRRPAIGNVRAIYDYIRQLPLVREAIEWGEAEVEWTWGVIMKREESVRRPTSVHDAIRRVWAPGNDNRSFGR
jgi:predicted O-methyltransferase YrrM